MTVVAAIVSGADPGHYHGSMLCNRIRRGVRGSRVITEGAAQAQRLLLTAGCPRAMSSRPTLQERARSSPSYAASCMMRRSKGGQL